MDDLLAHAVLFDQFQRDVVILIARQARAQAFDLHRKGKPHLDARIKAFQIGLIVVQRRFDHLKAEGRLGVLVEAAHDAGHVDALLVRIKADRAGDRGFKRQIAAIAGVEPDRQAEVGNAHMLDLLLRAADQAGGAVLQIRQVAL